MSVNFSAGPGGVFEMWGVVDHVEHETSIAVSL